MKYGLFCSTLVLLVACGGQAVDTTSSSSTSSSSSSSNSGSSSSSSSSSNSSSSGGISLPSALTSVVWELRYLDTPLGIRRATTIPMTLLFDEDQIVQGTTACGDFSANFWVRHQAMGFSSAPRVPLNCLPNPSSLLERDYYAALNYLVEYSVDSTQLTLRTADNTTLVFEPVGTKCASPKPVSGNRPVELAAPLSAINVTLTTANAVDALISHLEAEYADLVLRTTLACGPDQVAVTVNRVTLEHLRCRADISSLAYE